MIESLKIYKSPYEKKRIGRNRDGGYVIAWDDQLKYDLFISGGISNDISFEEDFINKYGKDCEFLAYDGSIQKLPKKNPKIKFFQKMITPTSDSKNTHLKDIIQNASNIFLKMDIEGGEISWFNSLNDEEIKKFQQITIEFHWNVDFKVLERINQTHVLIHFHVNNYSGVKTIDYQGIKQKLPSVFECTYLRKDHFQMMERCNDPIPHPQLDFPNNPKKPDIILCQEPYNSLSYPQEKISLPKPPIRHKPIIPKMKINSKKQNPKKPRKFRVFPWSKKKPTKKKI